jgi:hypothetical protein
MSWGMAVFLRLVAFGAFLYFTECEAEGIYEYLIADQKGAFNYVVKAGVGFAIAGALLPMYAGHALKQRQWLMAIACWLATPLVVSLVLFAAINRVGGAADEQQLQRDRDTRAGTLAAKDEEEKTKAWEDAREAATRECSSGPVNQQRGPKCLEAERKRDAARVALDASRTALREAPQVHPDAGARRVAAMLPITEAQVRLYQPLAVPTVMAILASLFATIAMTLKTPPMPRPWKHWRVESLGWRILDWRPAIDVTPNPPQPTGPAALIGTRRIGRMYTKPQAQPVDIELDPKPVVAFMKRRLPAARGAEADWGDIYAGFLEDWERQDLKGEPLTAAEFGQVLSYICERAHIRIERRGKRVVCVDRKLVA